MTGTLRGYPISRWLLAAACVAYPTIVYLIAIDWIADREMTPVNLSPLSISLTFAEPSQALFAGDMAARERFMIASAGMFALSLGVIAFALYGIASSRSPRWAALTALLAAAAGLYAAETWGNSLRDLAVERPLRLAAEEVEFTAHQLSKLIDGRTLMVRMNTYLGFAAVAALMARLADIALGQPKGEMDAAFLKARGHDLRLTIYVMSAVLTLATITTFFFNQYPVALMEKASVEAFGKLSGIASARWGATYTLVLGCALTPALVAFSMDRRAAIDDLVLEPDAPTLSWMTKDGFFDVAGKVASIIGVFAPALVAPVLGTLN